MQRGEEVKNNTAADLPLKNIIESIQLERTGQSLIER